MQIKRALTSLFWYNVNRQTNLIQKEPTLMDIILYLLTIIQYLYQLNCWLLNFICRYIPLKQRAFDDSHSPKYQKYKIDELPLITDFRQDWTYKELIPYFDKRYGKKIRPIKRQSEWTSRKNVPVPVARLQNPIFTRTTAPKDSFPAKSVMRSSPSRITAFLP